MNRRENVVRTLFKLDLSSLQWTEASMHPDAPMDPNAAFAIGQDRIYAIEMFRIFGKVLDFAAALSGSSDVRRGGRLQRGRYLFTVRQLGLQTMVRRWRR